MAVRPLAASQGYPPAAVDLLAPLPPRLAAGAAAAADAEDARSTTCSSHSEAQDGGSEQAEQVVNAMVPIVRRAMVSSNAAVFQASLDSLRQIDRMFGRDAIDLHAGTLAAALARHSGGNSGSAGAAAMGAGNGSGSADRASRVFATLTGLCSEDVARELRRQYPQLATPAPPPAAPPPAAVASSGAPARERPAREAVGIDGMD
eukprot:TRINITY_DN18856_c1_g1_i1.p1 TRINITY_DN18856_c1_g1~~TRINITY_DN18856_c1_g1_i1.p1  ORF type:complete len:204 (-),score=47.92 TRINITY_DN18856_c1_g1_i1:129-740(-)